MDALYVCSDEALSDFTPLVAEWHDCDPATYCARCHREWRLVHTVVTGSTAPRVPWSAETETAIRAAELSPWWRDFAYSVIEAAS
jgi:hypothetical protein